MLISSSGGTSNLIDGVSDQFPAGLRVLVVDDDKPCLNILEQMLRKCLYQVTKCDRAEVALKFLRDNKNCFDIVISDVHMPDMDGFKLLEHVGLEMDLPVIMMSADDSKDVVMKGVIHGACDYLIKPVRIEALKNIWQHVIRKTKYGLKEKDWGQNGSIEDGEQKQKSEEDVDNSTKENEGNWKTLKKRKDMEDEDEGKDETSALKKPRIVWSRELNEQFLAAINHIGYEKAVPKRILEVMNVPGLTRENVASHLQKYRIFLRKQNGLDSTQMGPPDVNFGSVSSFHGMEFKAMSSNQFPGLSPASLQSLVKPSNISFVSVMNQRKNLFSVVSPVEHQLRSNIDQMNFFHGIPTNIESNQLINLNQSAPLLSSSMNVQVNPQNSQLIVPMSQPVSRPNGQPILLNGVSDIGLARNGTPNGGIHSTFHPPAASLPPSLVDFSMNREPPLYGNIFSNARNTGGSRGFVNGSSYIDDFQQYKTRGLHTVGSTIDASHHVLQGPMEVPPSSLVQPVQMIRLTGAGEVFYSCREGGQNGNSNSGLPQTNLFMTNMAPNVKFDTYQQDHASCPSNNLYSQSSDDSLNALLKPLDDVGSVENVFDEYPSDILLD